MRGAERLDGYTQLYGGVAVSRDELVVIESNDVALALGDDLGDIDELARAVGQEHADREDTVALDQSVLHDRRHRDDVHVAAREDRHDLLPREVEVAQRGDGEKPRVLHDHLVVLHHVEERHDELLVFDRDDPVEVSLEIGEDLVARLLHGGAVGDGAHMRQFHDMPRLERGLHACGPRRFYADHLYVRIQKLGHGRYSRGEPAAADGHQDVVDKRQLLHDFHRDGALAGRDAQVVEGVHEGELALLGQLERAGVGLVVHVACEHDLSSERFGALHLDIGGRCGHDDGGGHAVALRRVGHALRVVAGRRGDEAALALVV